MKLFKSLFTAKANQPTSCSILSKEFINSSCQCTQQELNISETTWMDTTPYTNAKKALKSISVDTMVARYKSNEQRDLFEI